MKASPCLDSWPRWAQCITSNEPLAKLMQLQLAAVHMIRIDKCPCLHHPCLHPSSVRSVYQVLDAQLHVIKNSYQF